jgi:hypothetical protein
MVYEGSNTSSSPARESAKTKLQVLVAAFTFASILIAVDAVALTGEDGETVVFVQLIL